jgi:hypothetical protein
MVMSVLLLITLILSLTLSSLSLFRYPQRNCDTTGPATLLHFIIAARILTISARQQPRNKEVVIA